VASAAAGRSDAMEDLASVLEAKGERTEAIGAHLAAYEIYSRTCAARDAASVRDELRRLHLRHAFIKLGVRSRVELTRIVLASRPSSKGVTRLG
jgi:hypothetical protein